MVFFPVGIERRIHVVRKTSEREPRAPRALAPADPVHADVQGDLVRFSDHCRRSGPDLAALQRLSGGRRGQPQQPATVRMHQLRDDVRCRRQRGEKHPRHRHQLNRRTSGDGLRIEPDCRPEAGRRRPRGRKLGPSGPRVVTAKVFSMRSRCLISTWLGAHLNERLLDASRARKL